MTIGRPARAAGRRVTLNLKGVPRAMQMRPMAALTAPIRRYRRSFRDYGAVDTLHMLLAEGARALLSPGFRRIEAPAVSDLARAAACTHVSAAELASRHLDGDGTGIEELVAEEEALWQELRARYASRRLGFPRPWAVERNTSSLIYLMTRLTRPRIVLETGVANGHSTYLLLEALRRNGRGELHSVEVQADVGGLLTEEERAGWHLHLLPVDRRKEGFEELLRTIGRIDLFIHDSNHVYPWQQFEYASVLDHMAAGSIIASDDVDSSFAFIDFCERIGRRPRVLLDKRKAFGLVALDADGPPEAG
jgi:predicted O-methyltransferase YrrM